MAEVLKASRSRYYEWVKNRKSKKDIEDELFIEHIKNAFGNLRKPLEQAWELW
jgi:hypothetical protein